MIDHGAINLPGLLSCAIDDLHNQSHNLALSAGIRVWGNYCHSKSHRKKNGEGEGGGAINGNWQREIIN